MTMVSVGEFLFPNPVGMPLPVNTTYALSALTFDSTADKIAFIFEAREAMTLTDISWRTGTVTTGSTVEVRVETVSNGRPSGTLWNSPTNTTNATVSVADTDDNVWKTATLTASASIAAGDLVAIIFVHSSGSPNMQLVNHLPYTMVFGSVFPVLIQDTGGGTYAHQYGAPIMILENSGTPLYVPGLLPFYSATLQSFDSADAPDEYAMRIVPAAKMRSVGAAIGMANNVANGQFKVFLWDNSGATNTESNALAVADLDTDLLSASQEGGWFVYWSSPVTLSAGTTYNLGVRSQSATGNNTGIIIFNISGTGLPTDALKATPCGDGCYLRTRTWSAIDPGTVGAWSDDTTKQPAFRLLIDQIDDGNGSGGGGGTVFVPQQPGMTGVVMS